MLTYRLTSEHGKALPTSGFTTLGQAERFARGMAISSGAPIEVWTTAGDYLSSVRVSAFTAEGKLSYSLIETFARLVHKREHGEDALVRRPNTPPSQRKASRVRRSALRILAGVACNDNQAPAA